ncbi:MAG: hypothetical protein ABI565_02775 [Vicinamibacteria bacterium]
MKASELAAAARKQDADNSSKPPAARVGTGFDDSETVKDDLDKEIEHEALENGIDTKRSMNEDRQDGDIGDDGDAADAEAAPDGRHGPAYSGSESAETKRERQSHQQAPHDRNRL